jgi:hypothetical protein
MRTRLQHTLTTWPFLLSLVLLLANDWGFKRLWPGFISGKLSDVSGLLLLALLLLALWPQRAWRVCLGMVLVFAWWKSEAASPFIAAVQSLGLPWFGRTADTSDLWALAVLPLACWLTPRHARFALPGATLRRLITVPVASTTLLALMATSQAPVMQYEWVARDTTQTGRLHSAPALAIVDAVAQRHGLQCVRCGDAYRQAEYGALNLRLRYHFVDSNTWVFRTEAHGAALFSFERSSYAVAHDIETDLQAMLGAAYPALTWERRVQGVR